MEQSTKENTNAYPNRMTTLPSFTSIKWVKFGACDLEIVHDAVG